MIGLLGILESPFDAELRVVGNLTDGTPFTGTDIIRVIRPGKSGAQTAFTSGASGIPKAFSLSPNYPNPVTYQTTIRYAIPKESLVKLYFYDLSGRLVKTLVDAEVKPGYYTTTLDSKNLTRGIYFLMFSAGDYKAMRKLILVK